MSEPRKTCVADGSLFAVSTYPADLGGLWRASLSNNNFCIRLENAIVSAEYWFRHYTQADTTVNIIAGSQFFCVYFQPTDYNRTYVDDRFMTDDAEVRCQQQRRQRCGAEHLESIGVSKSIPVLQVHCSAEKNKIMNTLYAF